MRAGFSRAFAHVLTAAMASFQFISAARVASKRRWWEAHALSGL